MELLEHKAIFTAGYKAVLHIYSVVEECEIMELLEQIDPRTKKPMKYKIIFVKTWSRFVKFTWFSGSSKK